MADDKDILPFIGRTGAAGTGREEQVCNGLSGAPGQPERVVDVPSSIEDRLRRPAPPGMKYITIQMPEFGVNDD